MMMNLAIFKLELIFLILASLEKSRQSIYSYICFILVIVGLKIVLRELLDPADLFRAQILPIYETIEVVMIHKDKNLILVTF